MKCVCCKLENSIKEFKKHKSNTSLNAMSRQFDILNDLLTNPEQYVEKVCTKHKDGIDTFLDYAFKEFNEMKDRTFLLPKIQGVQGVRGV